MPPLRRPSARFCTGAGLPRPQGHFCALHPVHCNSRMRLRAAPSAAGCARLRLQGPPDVRDSAATCMRLHAGKGLLLFWFAC